MWHTYIHIKSEKVFKRGQGGYRHTKTAKISFLFHVSYMGLGTEIHLSSACGLGLSSVVGPAVSPMDHRTEQLLPALYTDLREQQHTTWQVRGSALVGRKWLQICSKERFTWKKL